MSYQFEDDSALEELLNQQLDKKRQNQPSGLGALNSRPSSHRALPGGPQSFTSIDNQLASSTGRPSTGASINKQEPHSAEFAPKSKLANWLQAKGTVKESYAPDNSQTIRSGSQQAELQDETFRLRDKSIPVIGSEMLRRPTAVAIDVEQKNPINVKLLEEEVLREDELQTMSKQRLVQLILAQVVPAMRQLRHTCDEQSARELARLNRELETERARFKSNEEGHLEELKQAETKRMQLCAQLESRLELSQRELNEVVGRQRSLVAQLEAEHKEQLTKLAENYKAKLAEEREQFEATLKRREQFQQLEVESKLKVNYDLVKLETIFNEWHKMIQTTIGELNLQFKSVETLLDKQTIEINRSNLELADKSKKLSVQYEGFEVRSNKLSHLADQIGELMPQFSSVQQASEAVIRQTSDQLSQLVQKIDQLRAKEQGFDKQRDLLVTEREQLNRERFQLGLDSNKLTYKEERLNELVQWNEQVKNRLKEQEEALAERQAKVEAQRSSLEVRSNQEKEQNYELHFRRRELISKEEKLAHLEARLTKERRSVHEQLIQVRQEGERLSGLREKAQKELGQLSRLQRSLICSICMERLFPKDTDDRQESSIDRWHLGMSEGTKEKIFAKAAGEKLSNVAVRRTSRGPGDRITKFVPIAAAISAGSKVREERESAKLSLRIDMDTKELEKESYYVDKLDKVF